MKHLHSKTRFRSCILYLASCMFLLLLSACGSGSDTSQSTSQSSPSDTGALAFSVVFQGALSNSEMLQAAVLNCAGLGVDTVEASIYDQYSLLLKSGGPWDCDLGEGTITGVPAGSNYTVVVSGKDSDGDILYQGEQTGITVTAGATTDVGVITLTHVVLVWDSGKWDKAFWD